MVSQKWQGRPWSHRILFDEPSNPISKETAVLFITGGSGNASDLAFVKAISQQAKLPTYVLYGIPNQPLYGGLTEDKLIAYTFQKYLETQDPTWPLLFPMTKSAIRAMDAIQTSTAKSSNPIRRFIVSGASKRGWTTWLVGAAKDPRVIAIAPMVIDNLNIDAQMKGQLNEWGKYSEQIAPYSELGLQEKFSTGIGKHLGEIVDPYSYRSETTMPTLVFKGSNDPYWTVDAMDRYWSDIKQPKWVVTVPNAGHGLGDKTEALESLGAFARFQAAGRKFPHEKWTIKVAPAGDSAEFNVQTSKSDHLQKVAIWIAFSKDLDFRNSTYTKLDTGFQLTESGATGTITFPDSGNVAFYVEATYSDGPSTYRLCSPTKLVKRSR